MVTSTTSHNIIVLFFIVMVSFSANAMEPLDEKIKKGIRKSWCISWDHDLKESINPMDKEVSFPEVLAPILESSLTDEEKQTIIKFYKDQEEILKSHLVNPLISPFGGINYAMTIEEMKTTIEKKFNTMKQQGLLINEKEFESIKHLYYTQNKHTDLTRVWGAEYLKDKINSCKELREKYAVPDYIIVANDLNNMKVEVWLESRFPVAGDIKNAAIYFKKIVGIAAGYKTEVQKDIGEGSVVNYTDLCKGGVTISNYKQNENIIQDSLTGKYYIVDTERRSFGIKLDEELNYAVCCCAKKFEYYNNITITPGRLKPIDYFEYELKLAD